MIWVRMPCRRYVGSTPTQLTPATGAVAPGRRMRKPNAPAIPTGVLPSNAARLRSNSNRERILARPVADGGEPWNACWSTTWKASNSSGVIGRIG